MLQPLSGIHHVTAIAGSAQRNIDFYVGLLGMRMVKRTVNFDDVTAYHFYFGDEVGTPGSLLTFFPYEGGLPGVRGAGQVVRVGLGVAKGALAFWWDRLRGLAVEDKGDRIWFDDPDGMGLEIAEVATPRGRSWAGSTVEAGAQVSNVNRVYLSAGAYARSATMLTEMGAADRGSGEFQFADGSTIVMQDDAGVPQGQVATGSVHHVAFRAADEAHQAEWRTGLMEAKFQVTQVRDRQYFRSIYYREPSSVLYEIATDGPGMSVDEPLESLGKSLKLPPFAEPNRAQIEKVLPPIKVGAR